MLNEWSDRPAPRPARRWHSSGEFWLGVVSMLIALGMLAGFGARVFG